MWRWGQTEVTHDINNILEAAGRDDWRTLRGIFEGDAGNAWNPDDKIILDDPAERLALLDELWPIDMLFPRSDGTTIDRAEWDQAHAYWSIDKIKQQIITVKKRGAQAANYAAGLQNATSFEDIFNIFKHAFGWSVDRDKISALKTNAGKFRAALQVLNDRPSDVDAVATALFDVSNHLDNKAGLLETVAYLDPDIKKQWYEQAAPRLKTIGADLLYHYKGKGQEVADAIGMDDLFQRALQLKADYETYRIAQDKIYNEIAAPFDARAEAMSKEHVYPLVDAYSTMVKDFTAWQTDYLKAKPYPNVDSWDIVGYQAMERKEWQQQGAAYSNSVQEEMHRLQDRIAEANKEFVNPVNDEKWAALEVHSTGTAAKLTEMLNERDKVMPEIHRRVMEHLKSLSPVTEKQAREWIKANAIMDKPALAKAKKVANYDKQAIENDLVEFYRVTQGRVPRLEFTVSRDKKSVAKSRSAAAHWTGALYVGDTFGPKTFWHELAHLLEDDPKLFAAARAFRDSRRESETLYKLKDLTGANYGNEEVAYKDNWIDPYVGKDYGEMGQFNSSEVLSMGFQFLARPEMLLSLMEKDPEHLKLVLGICASPPIVDQAAVAQKQGAIQQKKADAAKGENTAKDLDAKIAKAGDFWTGAGWQIKPYVEDRGFGVAGRTLFWVKKTEGYSMDEYFCVKEKTAKRALYLYLVNEQQGFGMSLSRIARDLEKKKKIPEVFTTGPLPQITGVPA